MTTYTVLQGRTITLPVEWLDYPGGPASTVTGVTVEIKPAAGGTSVVGPTSTGVVHVATGLDTYAWAVPSGQTVGDYAVIWTGLDGQGDTVTATDLVTVQDMPPAGAYASVADLTEKLGRTPINAAQLLVRASRDVDRALLCAVYDPTDQAVQEALAEATVEQVAAGLDNGDVTGNGTTRGGSFTIGRLSVQAPAAGSTGAAQKIGPLWSQAYAVLQAAGLTGFGPQSG